MIGLGLFVRFTTHSRLARCCLAVGLIGATTLVRMALTPVLGGRFPFLLQFIALIFCARYLGLLPGLAAWTASFAVAIGRVILYADPVAVSSVSWFRASLAGVFCLFLVWLLSRHGPLREDLARSGRLAA